MIKKFKEMWADPKQKGILQIGLFVVFFFVLYFVGLVMQELDGGRKYDTPIKTSLENFEEISNYEYDIEISYLLDNVKVSEHINGMDYENVNTFTYNNEEYHLYNEVILKDQEVVDDLFKYDLKELNPKKLVKEINALKLDKTITFNDRSIKKIYVGDKKITTYELNSRLEKIVLENIDIEDPKITNYNIVINYRYITKVD